MEGEGERAQNGKSMEGERGIRQREEWKEWGEREREWGW